MQKVIVITGASKGIGKSVAELFLNENCIVYNLSRSLSEVPNIKNILTDISDPSQIEKAFNQIILETNRIDVLINCAGFGISGSIEDTDLKNVKKIFEVNFFGTAITCKYAIPLMRNNKGGCIINISSVAGKLAIPFQAYYSATKSAIISFSTALKHEVKPFNISVATVLPGDVKTSFTKEREKNITDNIAYGDRIKRSVEKMETDENNGMNPMIIAKHILNLSKSKKLPILSTCGISYKIILFLSKILPECAIFFLINKLYG